MEAYQSMSDINEMDYQEYRSIVKTFLNDINDSIYLLKQNGYDTKDLYVVYDMLRYEVLSDKNIAILYRQGRGQEIVQKLKTYNGLVSDLTEQLNASRELKNEHDEELNKINSKIKSLRKPEKSLDTSDMFNGIVSIALAATTFLTAKISYYLYKSEFSVPQTEYYKVDTENNVSESKEFIKDTPEAEVLIEEYLETDNSGHRIKRVYSLNPTADMDINSEELMDIDLSKLKPISEEMVLDKKINDLNKDYYRVLKSTQINEEEKGIAKGEIAYKIFIITACTIIGLTVNAGIHEGLEYNNDKLIVETISDVYHYLIELAKYKIELRRLLNRLDKEDEEYKKYEKLINTLSNRIDKLITSMTENISTIEMIQERRTVKAVEKKDKEVSRKLKEKENEKQEIYKSIAMLAQTLSKSIEKAKNFSDSDYSSLLHTIPITEDILFEKEEDHYVIKSMFIPMLKLLNLSLIDFTNVDIRCIDFRETNATIDLTKIYNKDASFCTFEDGNIPDWKDYRGVNLTGATLGEDIHTMVGLDGAIVDEKTSFKTR